LRTSPPNATKHAKKPGVYKYRMDHYKAEMQIHLRISLERKAEIERLTQEQP